jgi:peptide/nickel transport system substrate-binding protein
MNKKIVWLALSFLMVVALVLASCGPAAEEEEGKEIIGKVVEKEEKVVEKEKAVEEEGPEMVRNTLGQLVEKPQYGGTIRYRVLAHQARHYDPIYWDANNCLSIVMDRFVTAPWEKGPAGTKELALDYSYYPQVWYRGELLENFEVIDIHTVKYTLRKGIHYWNKPPVNGREMTVDDVIWNFLRQITHPKCETYMRLDETAAVRKWTEYFAAVDKGDIPKERVETYLTGIRDDFKPVMEAVWPGLLDELQGRWAKVYKLFEDKGYNVADTPLFPTYINKIDKYTWELVDFSPNVSLWSWMASIWPIPREVVETYGHGDDWDRVVGTGPWIPSDYVADMSVNYVKNPAYWQNDPLLPEYRLPYADRLVVLVIVDDSTYQAALRTGKIDIGGVPWNKVESFRQTCPEMLHKQSQLTWTHTVSMRTDIEPFSDVRVRQACMLAVDHSKMAEEFYKGLALIYTWPEQPAYTMGYTPPEELPEDIRYLYEYHPDKAKELLAEAGYPNGFKTKMIVYPSQDDQESCLIFQEYLKAIGIDAEIEVPEAASYISMLYGKTYQHMISCWWGNNFPADGLNWAEGGEPGSPYNFSAVVDTESVAVSQLLRRTLDENERDQILKKENMRHMRLVYNVILPTPVGETFWWPWLKGYDGQTDLGWPDESGWGEIPKYLWIDQGLKDRTIGKQ